MTFTVSDVLITSYRTPRRLDVLRNSEKQHDLVCEIAAPFGELIVRVAVEMHSISLIALVLFGLTGTLVLCQTSLDAFYTTEFPEYSTDRETVYTVLTCEAPSEVSAQAALSLTTVLDTSGSMRGTPIQLLKRTVQFLVRKLLETSGVHSLGVIGYDTDVCSLLLCCFERMCTS